MTHVEADTFSAGVGAQGLSTDTRDDRTSYGHLIVLLAIATVAYAWALNAVPLEPYYAAAGATPRVLIALVAVVGAGALGMVAASVFVRSERMLAAALVTGLAAMLLAP